MADLTDNLYLSLMHSSLSRMLSLGLGILLALFVLIWPQHVASSLEQLDHGKLMLLMICMCMLFVHGVGFQFHQRMMQWLVSPLILWPMSTFFCLLATQVI